jgi:16S rRNA (cytosine1402-N4)-methyltransferase
MTTPHIPVLAGELIDVIDPRAGEVAVDCTFGGGGHARLVAGRIGPTGTLICVDRDPAAEDRFAELSAELPCQTRFIRADFVSALEQLHDEQLEADLVYVDLGMSSMQVDTWARGFSYAYDAPLDMRMDPDQDLTAREIVNTWDDRRLARLLREYGEERYARRIADAVVRERSKSPLSSTMRLSEIVRDSIPAPARRSGGHPAKRTFQALRIEVNGELEALRQALPAALDAVAVGGRIVVLAYHSLEDRLVKRALVGGAADTTPAGLPVPLAAAQPRFRLLTRGAERPTAAEVAANPRAAPARLRAAERIRAA